MKRKEQKHEHTKLNQGFATAICGNDILSSALYVSGIAIVFAGVYAPIVLILVSVVLFFYKKVYTEVVEALPANGGAYNCLLNGSSKTFASVAGVMTILSYVATAVISAKIAVEYLRTVVPVIPVIVGTVILLLIFALLVISGIKDSAKVALIIFVIHVLTLLSFLIVGLIFYTKGNSHFGLNLLMTKTNILADKNILTALYFAFSASLLGISGFESSANFVEEQKQGVFRKTLRNMLLGVTFFNPLIALVVLNSMGFDAISGAQDFLLADAAHTIGGAIFRYIVAIDAFLVLAGAVLTSYVGVGGLINRMALDGCLPHFLTKKNRKESYPAIVMSFFLLASSILLLTKGDLLSLAGVYTISFLGVMNSFALGNLILKQTRPDLKRTYSAPRVYVVLAFIATALGIIGNIRINPNNFIFFLIYFVPSMIIVFAMLYQEALLKGALKATRGIPALHSYLKRHFHELIEGTFIVFIHHSERLYKIFDYINRNETGRNLVLIYCKGHDHEYETLKTALPYLQKGGVHPHFQIKLVRKDEEFGPEIIKEVSREFAVSTNRIFIGSIHESHPFVYGDLGGVRIIF